MPSWDEFQPFIVTGLALGGVYALSGVGMVVLYRTTGVLNLAFGAVGAMGALIAWQAATTADRPDAQRRLTVTPATLSGKPASRTAIRATLRLSSPA